MAEAPLEISVADVKASLDGESDLMLLDCREPLEAEYASIERAQLIPMSELAERLEELQSYQQGRIVVHCHLGGRSLQVAHWLRQQGFTQAQSMAGGIDAWSLEVDRSIQRYQLGPAGLSPLEAAEGDPI